MPPIDQNQNMPPGGPNQVAGPLLGKKRFSRRQFIIFGIIFAILGGIFILRSFAATPVAYHVNNFDSNPNWDAFNNLPTAASLPCKQMSFNFGWSGSGTGSYSNMIGGDFTHAAAYRAYYAKPITSINLDKPFSASGTLVVPKRNGVDMSFGWFNHATSNNWRSSDAVLMHVAQPPDTSLTEVSISSTAYSPKTPTMKVGDTVQWQNDDTADHQVVIDGVGTSPVLHKKDRYKHIFNSTGTYTYHDVANPAIRGSVTVQPKDFFKNSYSAFALIGTRNSLSNGTKASSLTDVNAYEFGKTYNWTLKYDPNGGPNHKGTLSMTLGDNTGSVDLAPEVRADGLNLDRFGLLATNAPPSGGTVTAYLDNVVINGAPALDFSSDPGWETYNNRPGSGPDMLPKPDCYVTNRQDFQYRNSNNAGGQKPGEIGGGIWPQPPAYYADRLDTLKFKTDTLYATGKISLRHDTLDSDLWLGWFNAGTTEPSIRPTCKTKGTGELICRDMAVYNLLGAHIGGPTHYGYRFTPFIRSNTPEAKINPTDKPMGLKQTMSINEEIPAFNTSGGSREFWICYVPNIDSKGSARVTAGLSPDPALGLNQNQASKIIPASFIDSASFNRFGVIGASNGGKVVEIFLDDLRYTSSPGDSGPADRCGTNTPPPPPGDTTAPSVNITSPAANATVSGDKVNLTANATDSSGIKSVQFKLDSQPLGSALTTDPYTLIWNSTNTVNGSHSLTATATDKANNSATSSAVSFNVSNSSTPPTDTTPPHVVLTKLKYGHRVSGSRVLLGASASDSSGISKVRFYLDKTKAIGLADTSAPYRVYWNSRHTTNGRHYLTAVATDKAGNAKRTTSYWVTVKN